MRGIYELKQLIVKESYRNNNIGKKLLIKTGEFAKKKNVHKMQLFTSRLNDKALEFYLRNGYKIEYELKDDIFHKTNYLLMKKL